MPHIAVPSVRRDELFAAAQARWEALLATRPDLEPAVLLQRRLLTLVIDLAAAVDAGRLPRLSLPPKYVATKLTRGVPAFSGEPIPLPVQLLGASLPSLCTALSEGGAGEAADHILEAIESGDIDRGSLLSASLTRDHAAIRTGAVHRGLSPDLMWLVAELAVSPFVHALQRAFVPAAALNDWTGGYCPACGSWPALAEAVGGQRVLRCSFCALAWELPTYACIYCGEHGKPFVTAAPVIDRKDRRLELCAMCAGYLKTVDVPELSPFPLLAISDLETLDLDVAATERGFMRPPLFEWKQPRDIPESTDAT
jgi:hypothetical protein